MGNVVSCLLGLYSNHDSYLTAYLISILLAYLVFYNFLHPAHPPRSSASPPQAEIQERHLKLEDLPHELLQLITNTYLPAADAAALTLCNKKLLTILGTVHLEQLRRGANEPDLWTFLTRLERDLPPQYIFCFYCGILHAPNEIRDAKYVGIPRKTFRACDDEDRDRGFVRLHSGLRIENFTRIMKYRRLGLDFKQLSIFSPNLRNKDSSATRVLRPLEYTEHGFTFEVDFLFTSEMAKSEWNEEVEDFQVVHQFPHSPCQDCIPLGKKGKQIFTAKADGCWGPSFGYVYFYKKKLKNAPKKGSLFFVVCTESFAEEHVRMAFGGSAMREREIMENNWIVEEKLQVEESQEEGEEEGQEEDEEEEEGEGEEEGEQGSQEEKSEEEMKEEMKEESGEDA